MMGATVSVVTSTGFECVVDKDSLDDIELLEWVNEMDEGNPLHLGAFIEKILGKEQKKRFYDHYRNGEGRVPTSVVSGVIINEVFPQLAKKNP